jgi:S1-C subfamily serine protease
MKHLITFVFFLILSTFGYCQNGIYTTNTYIYYKTNSNSQYTFENPLVTEDKFIIQVMIDDFAGTGKITVRNETANTIITYEVNGILKESYSSKYNFYNKIFAGKAILYGLSQFNTINLILDGTTNDLVSIEITSVEHQSTGQYLSLRNIENSLNSTGSGIIVANNGFVITNFHVVKNAKKIFVTASDNSKVEAKLISFDEEKDIALLKINNKQFNIGYTLNSASSEVGEQIFVLGFPLINLMGSEIKVTDGIISSLSGFNNDYDYYQVSAAVQPGNSGGPLFDSQGNLIGIITAKYSQGENVSYALKSKIVFDFLKNNKVQIPISNETKLASTLVQKIKILKTNVISIESIRQ